MSLKTVVNSIKNTVADLLMKVSIQLEILYEKTDVEILRSASDALSNASLKLAEE